ncbi:MAG TPA: kelch repeat-containing protein [Planctomycetota bacterium]|nr:kelch repeat-containing protein [Planctomycetota bacterium]
MKTVWRLLFGLLLASVIPACGGNSDNPKPPATLAIAPTTLVATAITSARIDLSWVDASDNEFEFRIERSSASVGPYTQIGTAPKNAQAYSDLGLPPNTTQFYRVTAWNSVGNSPYAGPASAATQSLAWTAGSMTGGPTVGRGNQSAVFDSFGQQMLVFGGIDDSLNVLNELWALDLRKDPIAPTAPALSAWSAPTNSGAPSLYGHSAIYDTAHQRMIVFGGWDDTFTQTNDVYVLDLSVGPPYTWTKLVASGPTPTITGVPPAVRGFHTAVYDSANQQMIVYGGYHEDLVVPTNTGRVGDIHILSLPTAYPLVWSTPAVLPAPFARSQHTSITDPIQGRMIMFGGEDSNIAVDGSVLSNETWAFVPSSNSWIPFFFSGTPSFKSGHSSIYDAANRRMVVFGGESADVPSLTLSNELWEMRLDAAPAWGILNAALPPGLTPRYGHSAIYDSAKNRMVIYGGFDPTLTSFNQLWVIKL